MFGKLKQALKKTREVLAAGFNRLFAFGRKLDEAFLDDREHELYQADNGPRGTPGVEEQ